MRRLIPLFWLLLPCLLASCSRGVFNPKGEVATTQYHLFFISIGLMMIVVIPVYIMLAWFVIRYRASKKPSDYAPDWSHNTWLEIIWWAVPLIIVVILSVITWYTSHSLSPYKSIESSKKPLNIDVVAMNWKWLFIYPDEGIATVNTLTLPVNRPIAFRITSDGPMNSFVIPQLAGQIYAMNGMTTQLHLITQHTGTYAGLSANYSGVGFYGMHFKTHVVSNSDFQHWLGSVKSNRHHLSWQNYQILARPSKEDPPQYFGAVGPELFEKIIDKYLVPAEFVGKGEPQEL